MASMISPRSCDSDRAEQESLQSVAAQYPEEFFTEDSFHSFINGLPTIYGITSVTGMGCTDSLVVALYRGKVLSYSLKSSGPSFANPDCCELFKSMTTDTVYTAIDFMRLGNGGFALALVFCKEIGGRQVHTLSICAKACSKKDHSLLENIELSNPAYFELGAQPPFQVTHCQARPKKVVNESLTPVFLLLGGDCRIRVYSQNDYDEEFSERLLHEYFPEFENVTVAPLWVDSKITQGGRKRISVLGKASGQVSLYVTDLTSDDWVRSCHEIECDSPVTSVRLFSKFSSSPKPEFLTKKVDVAVDPVPEEPYHLLVTCARESAIVYCYCGEQGFQFPLLLEQSSNFDCVTCCEIADVNRDGKHDIVVGTYGHQLLVYPFDVPAPPSNLCCPTSVYPVWTKRMCYPIVGIKFLDVNSDGLEEMVVVSTKGMHVLHCDTKTAIDECIQKLEWLRKFGIR